MSTDQVFYSVIGERPVRLSQETRALAARALSGEFGRSMVELPMSLDTISGFTAMWDIEEDASAVRLIAENAPLRLVPGEMLAGAATLDLARKHLVPVRYQCARTVLGISHVTCGFERVLQRGTLGLEEQIRCRLAKQDLDQSGIQFLEGMLSCLQSIMIWHQRHLALLEERLSLANEEEKPKYAAILEVLHSVPEHPAQSFRQAVQSLWFIFAFLRLCGNWPGIGRIDWMLGPYLQRDLASGCISIAEARELLAHFWIKGCEWITLEECVNGDGQHYQNIVLGGIDEHGIEVTNEVTYLVLDVVEELGISDFPIAVRISQNSPEKLLRRIAEVQRHGGGIVAVYNEGLIIDSLVDFGYERSEARQFANDGCWEVQVPGKTCFGYYNFDMFGILQNQVLRVNDTDAPAPDYDTFEQLYAAFQFELRKTVESIQERADEFKGPSRGHPALLISLLTDDCIEKACNYDIGARYRVGSPHAGGLPDTANSLLAIQRLVYQEKRLSLLELVECLRNNWEGQEILRRRAAYGIEYFGNDNAEADALAKRVYDDYVKLVVEVPIRNGVLRPPGISTFGRQIEWRWKRGATADGHLQGEILSNNLSPTPGSDQKGATAIIKSHCSLGLQTLTGGTALEIKLFPETVAGEKGIETLISLLEGFIALGGNFMHTDVIDNRILLEAQQNPERYQNLAVRVAGWSARFVTLNQEWQEMIIQRTSQGA